MRTYPILREDGTLHAFEISSAWLTYRPIFRILRSVDGVTTIKRKWFSDDRIAFQYRGRPCVVNEPWGDNSRFWVGPSPPDPELDITALHEAFKRHRGLLTFDREFRSTAS